MLIEWKDLTVFEVEAGAEIAAPWVLVLEVVQEITQLRISANGEWTVMAGLMPCKQDGLAGLPFAPERLVVPDCPVGALVGKIGGSSASVASGSSQQTGDARPFAIGSFCIVAVPEKSPGPLFVGFNCLARPVKVSKLRVDVKGAFAA